MFVEYLHLIAFGIAAIPFYTLVYGGLHFGFVSIEVSIFNDITCVAHRG